MIQFHRQFAHN